MKKPLILIFLVLLADQILKFWIKTNLALGDEIKIADWFILHFTENPGMAFGLEFGGIWGKMALSLFRIITVGFIFYWLMGLVKRKAKPVAITAVALIFAGAFGNILDSAFYGLIFDSGTIRDADNEIWLRYGGVSQANFTGYAGFLQGCVVDMFYFPLYKGYLPDWIPFKGGDYFVFFRPVFNLADASISVGVGLLILFQKAVFGEEKKKTVDNET